jgi:anaerobic selenocysteine-containing dehydrogenase
MKSKLVASALLGLALAVLTPGRAQTESAAGASSARAPQTIVPYLSHGAGVWVERSTGRPVSRPGASPAPATPGVHYLRP